MKTNKTMGAIVLTTISVAAPGISVAQAVWGIDRSHSKVGFSVTHLMISEVEGQFKIYDGKVISKGNDWQDASVEFSVDVNSVDTDDESRDKHLKSDDFFSAEKFPAMKFKGISMKKVKDNKYKLTGMLTIRDVTRQVELEVDYKGTMADPWGNTKAGFHLSGEINRMDYGLKWNAALEAGGVLVGETVKMNCKIELVKQK